MARTGMGEGAGDEKPLDDPTGQARARRVKRFPVQSSYPVDTSRLCKATAKSTGKPCQAHPVLGYDVCESHGAGGAAGGAAVHGRASSLAERLSVAFQNAMADPKLMDLRRGLGRLDAILQVLQERLEQKDTPDWRRELRETWFAFVAGKAKMQDVEALIESGAESDRSLMGLFEALERFQKRVEEARRVKIAGAVAVNARDLNTALVRLLDELARGASAEGLPAEVVSRLVERMEITVREIGLDPSAASSSGALPARN